MKLLWQKVDVECECLGKLEEEMFELSETAGIAGEYQWGLDAGSIKMQAASRCRQHQDAGSIKMQAASRCRQHQDAGSIKMPGIYPCHWIHIDRLENDDNDKKVSDTLNIKCNIEIKFLQLQPGPNFIKITTIIKPTVDLDPKPHLKPCQKNKL